MNKIIIISIYDSCVYGISIMKNGRIYHSDYSKVAREIWEKYRQLNYREFEEYLRNKYPKHKIIICDNGGIEKL